MKSSVHGFIYYPYIWSVVNALFWVVYDVRCTMYNFRFKSYIVHRKS